MSKHKSMQPFADDLDLGNLRESILIKYCNLDMVNSIRRGSVWLASHEKYRASSISNIGLLSDHQEGEFMCNIERLPDRPVKVGGIEFLGGSRFYGTEPGAAPISVYVRETGFVFCTALGPYDRRHHKMILEGWPGYPENRDRLHFVAFKAGLLLDVLSETAAREHGPHEKFLDACPYNQREGFVDTYANPKDLQRQIFLLAAYSKPETYFGEKEIRIVLRFQRRNDLHDLKFLKLEVPDLGSTILEIGRY
jgi:hypothetical protein